MAVVAGDQGHGQKTVTSFRPNWKGRHAAERTNFSGGIGLRPNPYP